MMMYRASMGPRSIDRGTTASSPASDAARELQWGRDRSIAELSATAFYLADYSKFQWGRDRSIAELIRASAALLRMSGASMAPRSIDRGTIKDIPYRWANNLLQWGRDRSIAELVTAPSGAGGVTGFNGAAIDRSRNWL